MQKTFKLILILTLLISGKTFGQTVEIKGLVNQGIKLHDQGDYKAAIELYKKALKIDPKSSLTNYEIASSYFSSKEYETAIEYSNNVIANKLDFVENAYILKGSALDIMGKPDEAIVTYREAIKQFPNNYLLYYNLGYTYYNQKNYTDAEAPIQKALKIKSSHASSHLVLGFLMSDQGYRVKSLLALYNFLLLEPTGARAEVALELLESEQKKGVTKVNEKTTNITLSANTDTDEFRAAELMLSMLEASKNLDENKNKTQCGLFSDNTKSFFTVLGELKKNNNEFWWNFYVDFFYTLTKEEHGKAFCYYITQSKSDNEISSWLKSNTKEIEAFSKWYSNYNRKS